MRRNTIIISLCFLITGFLAAYFIFGYRADQYHIPIVASSEVNSDITSSISNPFSVKEDHKSGDARVDYLENEVRLIKQQLQQIELDLEELTSTTTTSGSAESRAGSCLTIIVLPPHLPGDYIILITLSKGGIDPSLAEDIVRRKNSIELKRLALQDLATREGYLDTQQYYDELEAINVNDISLREELGDQRYDEYLFNSKQNNRIRISSVMLGSAAEQAGIQDGDVVTQLR